VRAIVLRGDGAHFCAGGNLQRLLAAARATPEAQAQGMSPFHGFVAALRGCPKPTIAAVEGWAAGGGCGLVLACDLVIAAQDAQFVLSWGRIGLSPDGGTSWHLAHLLPRTLALQMLWLPETMSAQTWHRHGLVNELVASGQAQIQALAWAERLAAMAPNALAAVKALVNAAPHRTLPEQLDAERPVAERLPRILAHLKAHPTLSAAQLLLPFALTAPTELGDDARQALREAVARAARPLQRYRCASCGFDAQRHFWQCPGCLTWDSFPPQRSDLS
jgi:enoyl-CoA hydratase/carnithine racemase